MNNVDNTQNMKAFMTVWLQFVVLLSCIAFTGVLFMSSTPFISMRVS